MKAGNQAGIKIVLHYCTYRSTEQ
eukprot:COSAG02_NODE_24430_length_688_cov_1.127334_1_plen_23_part_10